MLVMEDRRKKVKAILCEELDNLPYSFLILKKS